MNQPTRPTPPVVSVIAKSGTGKTTLLEKLIPELKRRKRRVGVIKHDAHRFDIDRKGKDSWRLTNAGADTMVICSDEKLAMVKMNPEQRKPTVEEMVALYYGDVDIVLTEGFSQSALPKIEISRQEVSTTLLSRGEKHDPALLAVATDYQLEIDVPRYDINDVVGLADLIEEHFLS
jgi:molybdopterin-guanine dinucleotide biosynthesis protein MobB